MKLFLFIIVTLLFFPLSSQVFEREKVLFFLKKGADHIYNANTDSSHYYIGEIRRMIPGHPVIPLMEATTLLWSNIPTISEEIFFIMERKLDSAILLAKQRDPDLKDPEMIFFAMSAHGLLAEYYADQGHSIKAINEANKAYGLLRKGIPLVNVFPEFLFASGLYNYFREKYPEKYPLYKPLLWFFKEGNIALGLQQLERASQKALLTKVEANVYLSYIYLRYENNPKKAQSHLHKLCKMYPNNYYVKAKYLESLANSQDFRDVSLEMIHALKAHKNPYYKLVGYVFLGFYEEKILNHPAKAEYAYRKGLEYGEQLSHHGEYFKSLGYLRLGRLLITKGKSNEAKKYLSLAAKFAETEQIESEVKALLSKM